MSIGTSAQAPARPRFSLRFTARELVTVAIFAVIFIVVTYAIGMLGITSPLTWLLAVPVSIIVYGIPFMTLMGGGYIRASDDRFSLPVLGLLAPAILIAGFLGGLLGSAVLRKRFVRASLPDVEAPAAVAPERRRELDPRSKIILVVLVSTVVMSPGGLRFVPVALALAVALAIWEGAWRRAVALPVVAGAMWVLGWLLPLWWPNAFTAIVSIACVYLIRFVVAIGVGMHVIATTSPTQLSVALRSWRIPRAISVTLAVMLRFFPVVASEAAAVRDAMRLRGLTGPTGFLRHPILSLERFAVPMIAASLRASEDLSASAILRGLGSRRTPTSMNPPRFAAADATLLLAVPALAAWALLLPPLLS